MLKLRGESVELSKNEEEEIVKSLENARKDENRVLPVAQGYEIARWLMLATFFEIDNILISEQDKEKIIKGANEFKRNQDFTHLASLIKTSEFLGVEIDTSDLIGTQRRIVENEISKM